MKLIDIQPKLEALEKGLDGAMQQIGDLEKRLEQLAEKHETHNHDETPTLLQEAVEVVEDAAEKVTEVVEETAEEVGDAFTTFAEEREAEEEESDGDDATFPEASQPGATQVKVEPVPETDDAPPVDPVNHVEVLNKETGETYRIHRNQLDQIIKNQA